MPSLRVAARWLAAAVLTVAQTGRADVVVTDYGSFGNSNGVFTFSESTGAASGTQPFIQPVGSPSNPYDAAYSGDGYQAEGSAYGPDGNLYVGYFIAAANSGTGIGEVRKFNSVTGAYISTFVAPGSGGLVQPGDIKFQSGTLYVADHGNFVNSTPYGGTSVITYDSGTGANTGAINFGFPAAPSGMEFDPRPAGLGGNPNNLYISLFNTNQVMQYNTSTHSLTTFATGNGAPPGFSGLGFGPDGNLYVVNLFAANVQQFNGSGTYLSTLPSTGSNTFPDGIAFTQGGKFLVSTLVGPGNSAGEVLSYDSVHATWNTFATSATLANAGPLTLTPIAGDGNSDGIVNGLDVAQVASHWLSTGPTADVNRDGIVNGLDVSLIATNWLHTGSIYGGGGGGQAVPEPATIVLALMCVVCALAARARRRSPAASSMPG